LHLLNFFSDATVWNLKVGSVFGFLHPETAVSVFGFTKKMQKNIKNRNCGGFGFGLLMIILPHCTLHCFSLFWKQQNN